MQDRACVSIGPAGSAPRFLSFLSCQEALRLWKPSVRDRAFSKGHFSDAQGRGPWGVVHCTPGVPCSTPGPLTAFSGRSLSCLSSRAFSCPVVQPGRGTVAAVWLPPPCLSWLWLPSSPALLSCCTYLCHLLPPSLPPCCFNFHLSAACGRTD